MLCSQISVVRGDFFTYRFYQPIVAFLSRLPMMAPGLFFQLGCQAQNRRSTPLMA
jgi:hypothetical protein